MSPDSADANLVGFSRGVLTEYLNRYKYQARKPPHPSSLLAISIASPVSQPSFSGKGGEKKPVDTSSSDEPLHGSHIA